MVLQSTNYLKLVPANWNCHYCSPHTMVCRKLIMANIMKTNIRMSEHLMRQSSGELPVLWSQLTKHGNLSVKISLRKEKMLNYYHDVIALSFNAESRKILTGFMNKLKRK